MVIILYLYDNAIIEDINKLFTNSSVRAVMADSLDEAMRRSSQENEDKMTLPFIAITGGDWQLGNSNFYSLMHGLEDKKVECKKLSKQVNIIPITPSYDMYIVAKTSRECDMLTREIIFHYMQNPTLVVNVPYGLNDIHTFNINFENNIRKTQRPTGLVYRVLSFSLEGAYLWHVNTFNVLKDVDVESVKEEYDV